jgi:hypothetical protein
MSKEGIRIDVLEIRDIAALQQGGHSQDLGELRAVHF